MVKGQGISCTIFLDQSPIELLKATHLESSCWNKHFVRFSSTRPHHQRKIYRVSHQEHGRKDFVHAMIQDGNTRGVESAQDLEQHKWARNVVQTKAGTQPQGDCPCYDPGWQHARRVALGLGSGA